MEHAVEPTAARLWDEVSSRLREALNETTYGTWFGEAAAAELTDDAFVIQVPNDFTREWIEGHFLGFIKAATRDALGREEDPWRSRGCTTRFWQERGIDDAQTREWAPPGAGAGCVHGW